MSEDIVTNDTCLGCDEPSDAALCDDCYKRVGRDKPTTAAEHWSDAVVACFFFAAVVIVVGMCV